MSEVVNQRSNKEVKPTRREVRHVLHIPASDKNEDLHYVKETITLPDGSRQGRTRLIANYLRPAMVTQEKFRNHIEKKEWEDLDKIIIKKTTQSDYLKTVANMLDKPHLAGREDLLFESPYLYAGQFTTVNMIKLASLQKNDFKQSPYKIMAFDLEARPKTDELLVGSNVIRGSDQRFKAHVSVVRDWVKHIPHLKQEIDIACKKLFTPYEKILKVDLAGMLDINLNILDTEVDVVQDLFLVANEWSPDIMSIWNMDYDINTIILPLLEKHGLDPVDYLCDQSLPRHLRRFKYIQGRSKKITASGKETPIHPADRWHKCYNTAKFVTMDSMCSFRALRMHMAKESSYALEAICQKILGIGKLVVPGTEKYKGEAWHVYMQTYRIVEYIVYNIIDNILLLLLDEKTGDLSGALPTYAESTDFNDFGSSDMKSYCSLFRYGMTKNRVIGTACNLEKLYNKYARDESLPNNAVYHDSTMSLKGWIQTLNQEYTIGGGLKVFKDYKWLKTNVRGMVTDIDSVSSYPSCIMTLNVSKETCRSELLRIIDYPEITVRSMGLALVIGHTNTLEYGETLLSLPNSEQVTQMCLDGRI